MKSVFLLFFISFAINTVAQDYVLYHKIISRIDQDIVDNSYPKAIERFDSIYEDFDFVFASHCFKALQLSCAIQDSIHANKWLEKSFLQGVPMWMVRSNDLTKSVFNFTNVGPFVRQYDSLHGMYNNSINSPIRNTIDSLIEIDQELTKKVNDGFFLSRYTYHYVRWLKNNKRQFDLLCRIINQHGYPGEKLIGLPKTINDSAFCSKMFKHYGPVLKETHAYVMLIHFYSNPREDINGQLLSNIHKGNLPPYQFGALNDFMAKWGKKKYRTSFYYNVWHFDPNSKHLEEVNQRRNAIGLNSFEQQTRNINLWQEHIKNKKVNSEIIVE